MRRRKNKWLVEYIFIAVVAVIASIVCAVIFGMSSDSKKLVGTWKGVEGETAVLIFNADGTFEESENLNVAGVDFDTGFKGTYTVDEKEKVIRMYPKSDSDSSGIGSTWVYSYVLSDNYLTMDNTGSIFEGRKSFMRQ